jgi:hypothetical protein
MGNSDEKMLRMKKVILTVVILITILLAFYATGKIQISNSSIDTHL